MEEERKRARTNLVLLTHHLSIEAEHGGGEPGKERRRKRKGAESENEERTEEVEKTATKGRRERERTYLVTILMWFIFPPIIFIFNSSILIPIIDSTIPITSSISIPIFPPIPIIMSGKQQIVPPEVPMHLAATAMLDSWGGNERERKSRLSSSERDEKVEETSE